VHSAGGRGRTLSLEEVGVGFRARKCGYRFPISFNSSVRTAVHLRCISLRICTLYCILCSSLSIDRPIRCLHPPDNLAE